MTEIIIRELTDEEKAEDLTWIADQYQRDIERISMIRQSLYSAVGGSDGIFFKYQRGEASEQEWLDAVTAINDANPYPEAP